MLLQDSTSVGSLLLTDFITAIRKSISRKTGIRKCPATIPKHAVFHFILSQTVFLKSAVFPIYIAWDEPRSHSVVHLLSARKNWCTDKTSQDTPAKVGFMMAAYCLCYEGSWDESESRPAYHAEKADMSLTSNANDNQDQEMRRRMDLEDHVVTMCPYLFDYGLTDNIQFLFVHLYTTFSQHWVIAQEDEAVCVSLQLEWNCPLPCLHGESESTICMLLSPWLDSILLCILLLLLLLSNSETQYSSGKKSVLLYKTEWHKMNFAYISPLKGFLYGFSAICRERDWICQLCASQRLLVITRLPERSSALPVVVHMYQMRCWLLVLLATHLGKFGEMKAEAHLRISATSTPDSDPWAPATLHALISVLLTHFHCTALHSSLCSLSLVSSCTICTNFASTSFVFLVFWLKITREKVVYLIFINSTICIFEKKTRVRAHIIYV